MYLGEDYEFGSILKQTFPVSFVERLKVIEMNNFKDGEQEFKLIEYLLKNGKSLEKIALGRDGWKSVPNHYNRILSFKKYSKDCNIEFRKRGNFVKSSQLRRALNLVPWQ